MTAHVRHRGSRIPAALSRLGAWLAIAAGGMMAPAPLIAQSIDEAAIGRIVDGLAEAWNAYDADAWVASFDEDSGFTNILGMHFPDRAANRERHTALFETVFQGSRLESELLVVRPIGDDAAVAEIRLTLTGYRGLPPGISPTRPGVLETRLILALRETAGEWRVVAAQNTAILPPP
ncbi:MAG: SgcJ/EcaC family oxidoreductase [Gemmatimonadota bacterium]|nr:SgcJ/EcaC family oxidoreductase [Gemmatimonadota bacterium]